MPSISHSDLLAKLPTDELKHSLDAFLQPVTERLPDRRLRAVTTLLTQGIVASKSPIITQMARGSVMWIKPFGPPGNGGIAFSPIRTSPTALCSKSCMT